MEKERNTIESIINNALISTINTNSKNNLKVEPEVLKASVREKIKKMKDSKISWKMKWEIDLCLSNFDKKYDEIYSKLQKQSNKGKIQEEADMINEQIDKGTVVIPKKLKYRPISHGEMGQEQEDEWEK